MPPICTLLLHESHKKATKQKTNHGPEKYCSDCSEGSDCKNWLPEPNYCNNWVREVNYCSPISPTRFKASHPSNPSNTFGGAISETKCPKSHHAISTGPNFAKSGPIETGALASEPFFEKSGFPSKTKNVKMEKMESGEKIGLGEKVDLLQTSISDSPSQAPEDQKYGCLMRRSRFVGAGKDKERERERERETKKKEAERERERERKKKKERGEKERSWERETWER